jgi:hypothetical protein
MEISMVRLKPEDLLQWLLGAWTLSREAPGQASMQGHASFLQTAKDVAEYRETVSVQLVNHDETLHAQQRYEYRQIEEGLAVYFASPSPEAGELFHILRFTANRGALHARAQHVCRDDLYISEYILPVDRRVDRFSVRHDVEGPRKRYSLLSAYIRNSAPAQLPPMTELQPLR